MYDLKKNLKKNLRLFSKFIFKFRLIRLIISIIILFSFCGCSKYNALSEQDASQASISDIRPELLKTAQSIEKSLDLLAQAQHTDPTPVLNTDYLITPEGGMGHTADIDWSGPLDNLLNKLAEMTGYRLKVIGNHPSIPIIITLNKKNAVIADILKNASYQAAKRALVVVYAENKVIELRYATS